MIVVEYTFDVPTNIPTIQFESQFELFNNNKLDFIVARQMIENHCLLIINMIDLDIQRQREVN